MSDLNEPRRGRPNTYILPDGITPRELIRLHTQDQMFTASMGSTLPEQPDPTIFSRVLDVGCGTGCWLIAAAQEYPTITRLIGIDISEEMINFARKQAEIHKVSARVEFRLMDALQMLEFSTGYFDLVNQRFGQAYLRKWDWRQVLSEYRRVLRPEGVLRITDSDIVVETTSAAEARLRSLLLEAMYQAGHVFERNAPGMTNELAPLLNQIGLKRLQTQVYNLDYRAGTLEGKRFYEDVKLGTETLLPFIRKWTRLPVDYDMLRQQIDQEMRQPDFVARVNMLTVWGTK